MEIKTIRLPGSGISVGAALCPSVHCHYPSLQDLSPLPPSTYPCSFPHYLSSHMAVVGTLPKPSGLRPTAHGPSSLCLLVLIRESESDWWAMGQEITPGPVTSRERWIVLRHQGLRATREGQVPGCPDVHSSHPIRQSMVEVGSALSTTCNQC